ncbi:WD repeat-containing protein 44 isoform X1 [Carica papaya]|uniref:WD repeat-containing protein 44 isoform X1 n=1 Tax=Carica papaya TaxID=3649 RepID=UPI000B8CC3C4|nr:WD repeat-containing protein 44 isoform X1 [Carica papaya]
MSRQNDEEDEENECFYESLDRIVSSCSCSTSNSDSDSEHSNSDSPTSTHDPATDNDRASPFPVPRFPMGVTKFDIWISEPASVSERRSRLLREMGLSGDPALSRSRPGSEIDCVSVADFSRSASSDQLNPQDHRKTSDNGSGVGEVSCMVRSKSDGAASCCGGGKGNGNDDDRGHQLQRNSCSHSCSFSLCSSSILSIRSLAETGKPSPALVNNNRNQNYDHNDDDDDDNRVLDESRSSKSNDGSVASGASQNKPPSGKNRRRVNDSTSLNGSVGGNSLSLLGNACGQGTVEDLDCNGMEIVNVNEQACTIKNLDNGKEFVVKEIREDGMWDKLKEVETGRQLTMEEFEMTVGHSPIVQELMRRQNVEDGSKDSSDLNANGSGSGGSKSKKKGSWLKSIRSVASSVTGYKERRSSDERDTSSEKGGRRSSSATDDSQDVSFHGPERVRVRQYGKSCKEITALYRSQEIQAHNGSIWSIKFSLDGRYLASAGEDCVIHIWQVVESERKGELLVEKPEDGNLNLLLMANGSPEPTTMSPKRRGRTSIGRKSLSLDQIMVPETVFGLSEKPVCSFQGHLDDVLDLSWSKSQHLLSSSMDKTVRLWHLSSKTCLKIFSHSDYVTCIQFNPVDDRYFISGSLDAKVRIWSIPDRQVVDWNDLHEMVTAACYTPDGQGALVGSYKGSCCLYNTSDNKLQQKSQINLQNRKKKSHHKKITGFQFAPGSSSEVLITSADSRVRVIEGVDLVHKFKGKKHVSLCSLLFIVYIMCDYNLDIFSSPDALFCFGLQ